MLVETSVALLSATYIALLTIRHLVMRRDDKNPPGPIPLPLVGSLLDFPLENHCVTFTKWREQYGDIIYVNVLGKPMVILNSLQTCIDLLEKRSTKYSGRSRSIVVNDYMGFDYAFANLGLTPKWRRMRKLFHQHFNEHVSRTYQPAQERGLAHFLQRLLLKPEGFLDHVSLLFGEVIMDIVYDIKVESSDDRLIHTAQQALAAVFDAAVPGKFLVEFFPWMKYLPAWCPGGTFKTFAAKRKRVVLDVKDLPVEIVKKRMQAGTAGPSVLSSMFTQAQADAEKDGRPRIGEDAPEEEAKACAALAYLGGADTTVSTIKTLFMVLANNPDVQRAAWKELSTLLGPHPNRLPTHDDKPHLPLITAITKELLRWHNVVPLGIPRICTEDDEYNGYVIRKGTVILPNIWGILQDPEVFPDPFTFDPWRWLVETSEGLELNTNLPDPAAAFGFGRRICPGRHFASYSIFILIARILMCFDIKPLDEHGRPTERVKEDFTSGFIVYPVPYKVSITPRSSQIAQVIRDLDT